MKKNLFLLFFLFAVLLEAMTSKELNLYAATDINKSCFVVQNHYEQSYSSSESGRLTFYSNGGTGTMDAMSGLSEGQEFQLPKNTFTREGYRFVGWTNMSGSNEPIFQDEYSRFTYYSSYNSALYAIWEPEKTALKISFDGNGAKGEMEPIYVRAKQTIIIPQHKFVSEEEGYECRGFGIAPDDYARYLVGGTASFTGSCTLYAFWSPLDGSVGGACEDFKGKSVFVEGVNIAPEDWVQINDYPVKRFVEWKEGCGWYDTYQDWLNFCWAGTCSNVAHWWIDRNIEYIQEYKKTHNIPDFKYHGKGVSDIFNFFQKHWTQNISGMPEYAFDWFINGIDDYVQQSAKGKGGIFKDVFERNSLVTIVSSSINRRIFNNFIVEALKNKCAISISETNFSGSHAITCWGAEFDEEGYVNALYYTDSATPWNNSLTGRDLSLSKIDIKYHEDKDWRPYMSTEVLIDGEIQYGEIPIVGIYSYSQGTQYWEAYFKELGQENYTLISKDEEGDIFNEQTLKTEPDSDIVLPVYQYRTLIKVTSGGEELEISADGKINASKIVGNEMVLYYADNLPFETTTVSDGAFSDAHWYLLTSRNNDVLMMQYDGINKDHIDVSGLTESYIVDDINFWCISGNVTEGFKLYNKAAGADVAVACDKSGKVVMQDAGAEAALWSIIPVSEEGDSEAFGLQNKSVNGENVLLCLGDNEVVLGNTDDSEISFYALLQTDGFKLVADEFESKLHSIPEGAVGSPADRSSVVKAIETLKENPAETNYKAVCSAFDNKVSLSADKTYSLLGTDGKTVIAAQKDGFFRIGSFDFSDACGMFLFESAQNGNYNIKVQGEYLGAAKSNNANNEFGLEGRRLNGAEIKKGEFALIAADKARFYLKNINTEAGGETYLHLNGEILSGCGDRVKGTLWYLVEVPVINLTVSEYGYTTACYPFAVQLPQNGNLKAYTGKVNTGKDTNVIVLTELENDIVPAGTPVVIEGETGTYGLSVYAGAGIADKDNGNGLVGVLLSVSVTAKDYLLDCKDGVAGFYRVNAEDSEIEANKAYLPYSNIPASAEGSDKFVFSFDEDGGGSTGINKEPDSSIVNEEYYDLQGRRVFNPESGIYVTKSGKKVFLVR